MGSVDVVVCSLCVGSVVVGVVVVFSLFCLCFLFVSLFLGYSWLLFPYSSLTLPLLSLTLSYSLLPFPPSFHLLHVPSHPFFSDSLYSVLATPITTINQLAFTKQLRSPSPSFSFSSSYLQTPWSEREERVISSLWTVQYKRSLTFCCKVKCWRRAAVFVCVVFFLFLFSFFLLKEKRRDPKKTLTSNTQQPITLITHKVVCFLPSVFLFLFFERRRKRHKRRKKHRVSFDTWGTLLSVRLSLVKLQIALFRQNSLVTVCNRSFDRTELWEHRESECSACVFKVC